MLADIQIASKKIVFRGGEFAVRGITFSTVARLVSAGQRSDMEIAVSQLAELKDAQSEQLIGALSSIVAQLPTLTAMVIAEAANEPDEWEKVKQLPMPVQLEAILEIGKLTFDGADSVKTFVRGVLELMQAANSMLSQSKATIADGTGSTS